jgi:hypothetical protein
MVNNQKNSQHSPASSNSDLNSCGSDSEELDNSSSKLHSNHENYSKTENEHDLLDDLNRKLTHRMKIAPPAPPKSRNSQF